MGCSSVLSGLLLLQSGRPAQSQVAVHVLCLHGHDALAAAGPC